MSIARGPIQAAAIVAAVAATGIVLIAVFPFVYRGFANALHLPQLPEFLTFSVFLGFPGLLIAKWLGFGEIGNFDVKAFSVVLCAWMFYFVAFGSVFYLWDRDRKPLSDSVSTQTDGGEHE